MINFIGMFYKHYFGITGLEYLLSGCNPSIIHYDVKLVIFYFLVTWKMQKLQILDYQD